MGKKENKVPNKPGHSTFITLDREMIIEIYHEWHKNFAENPDGDWLDILDADGNVNNHADQLNPNNPEHKGDSEEEDD